MATVGTLWDSVTIWLSFFILCVIGEVHVLEKFLVYHFYATAHIEHRLCHMCRILLFIHVYLLIFVNCAYTVRKVLVLVMGYILFYARENSFDLGSGGTVGSQTGVYGLYLMYSS